MNIATFRTYLMPDVQGEVRLYVPVVTSLLVLFIIGMLLQLRKQRSLSLSKLSRVLVVTSVLGLVLYWLRYEGALYFDSSLWLWLIVVVFGIGLLWVLLFRLRKVPVIQEQIKKQQIRDKYLPTSKKTNAK